MIKKLINKLFHKREFPILDQYWIDAWEQNERDYRKSISEKFKDFEDRMQNDIREVEEYNPNNIGDKHISVSDQKNSRKMKKKFVKLTAIGAVSAFILFYFAGIIFPPSISDGRIDEALAFCKKNDLNTEYVVFVDFSKHSGRERYMIYSFSKHKVISRCLCASGLNKNKFSNQSGSNLSSLGKYRITNEIHNMSIGREGLVVDGLESSNSNARNRKILIHYSKVLNDFPKSIFPIPIIGDGISHGCFSITSEGVEKTKELRKPTLLWAYK